MTSSKLPGPILDNLESMHKLIEQVLGFVATELDKLTANGDFEGRLDYEEAMESATAAAMSIETLIAELRRIHTPTTGV